MLKRVWARRGFLTLSVVALNTGGLPAQVGFGGPGGFGSGRTNAANVSAQPGDNPSGIGISPFVGVSGTYNRELGDLNNNEGTFYGRAATWGASGYAGVTGEKNWSHTALGFGYTFAGNYWPYSQSKFTQNHVVHLGVSHIATPRLSFSANQFAGTTIGGYGYGAGFAGVGGFGGFSSFGLGSLGSGAGLGLGGLGSLNQNGIVDSEVVNARTNFYGGVGEVSYRLSERWTASAAAGVSFVRRSHSLFGNDWLYAGGELAYSIDARSQIGFIYQHSWMNYPNYFGEVLGQVAGVEYSRQLSTRTMFSVFVGGLAVRSTFVGTVPIDPEIAALLGTSTTYSIQKVQYYSSSFGGHFVTSRGRNSYSASAYRGISPGNGLLLAGVRDVATLNYGYSGNGKIGFSLGASAIRDNGVVGVRKAALNYTVYAATGYRLFNQIFWHISAGWRNQQFSGQPDRQAVFASTGFTWSPRENLFHF